MPSAILPSSFRDPSGFLFLEDDSLYRQINNSYADNYDLLMESGLYAALVKAGLLVEHEEVTLQSTDLPAAYKVIKPRRVPFISYPYEWCFSQLKDAALATLAIQKRAMEFGMSLKDASTYNIQFVGGRPTLIDTLSFEKYEAGRPWVAYRQFCQHFLAPLTLMSYQDIRLGQLLRVYIDGIPLDLAASLLPGKTKLRFSLLTHVHLHARSQKRHADKQSKESKEVKMSQLQLRALIDNLETAVRRLRLRLQATEWADYYDNTNYSSAAFEHKKEVIAAWLEARRPASLWDLGANTGVFSKISAEKGIPTVAFDIDPLAVERAYVENKAVGNDILPLLLDLSNPSPAIGWKNEERMSLLERGPTPMALALALIHHLAIANNVPLERIADFFSHVCESLVIEFVPKSDSQVRRLLATREDIFDGYTEEGFTAAFAAYFTIDEVVPVRDTQRTLYLMARKNRR